jgi:hypothetical protein
LRCPDLFEDVGELQVLEEESVSVVHVVCLPLGRIELPHTDIQTYFHKKAAMRENPSAATGRAGQYLVEAEQEGVGLEVFSEPLPAL